jgi:anti-anti-sigma factor
MESESPPLECAEVGGVRVFTVRAPQLLADVAEQVTKLSEAVLDQPGPRNVVLDLARVSYISSGGVTALVSLMKRVKALEGQLIMCGIAPPVAAILRLCQLIPQENGRGSSVLATAPDVADAVRRLTESA